MPKQRGSKTGRGSQTGEEGAEAPDARGNGGVEEEGEEVLIVAEGEDEIAWSEDDDEGQSRPKEALLAEGEEVGPWSEEDMDAEPDEEPADEESAPDPKPSR